MTVKVPAVHVPGFEGDELVGREVIASRLQAFRSEGTTSHYYVKVMQDRDAKAGRPWPEPVPGPWGLRKLWKWAEVRSYLEATGRADRILPEWREPRGEAVAKPSVAKKAPAKKAAAKKAAAKKAPAAKKATPARKPRKP